MATKNKDKDREQIGSIMSGISELVRRTEPAPPPADNSDLDKGRTVQSGIGLKQGEMDAISAMAAELGVTRNALMRFAVRLLIMQYRAGESPLSEYIEKPASPANKLRMPGRSE